MPFIKGKKCILRPFTMDDAVVLNTLVNHQSIAKYTTIRLPWSLEFSQWWIGFINTAAQKRPITEIHFAITNHEEQFMGAIGIINIDGHKGEIGYWIADLYSSQGVMTEAVSEVVNYAFTKMPLYRIFAPVLTYNYGSKKVLEKNGFQLEGTSIKHFKKNNRFENAWIYAKVR